MSQQVTTIGEMNIADPLTGSEALECEQQGKADNVQITPDMLHAFINKKPLTLPWQPNTTDVDGLIFDPASYPQNRAGRVYEITGLSGPLDINGVTVENGNSVWFDLAGNIGGQAFRGDYVTQPEADAKYLPVAAADGFSPKVKHNLTAQRAPTPSDNDTQGYSETSVWVDNSVSPIEAYKLLKADTGFWAKTTLGMDELGSMAAAVAGTGPSEFRNNQQNEALFATQAALANKVDKVVGKGLSTNDFTDPLKTKLEWLQGSHFRGTFVDLAALQAGVANPVAGDYADVDAGVGQDVERYIYDVDDAAWIKQGSVAPGAGLPTAPRDVRDKQATAVIEDSQANVAMAVDAEGALHFISMYLGKALKVSDTDSLDTLLSLVDSTGNACISIRKDGTLEVANLIAGGVDFAQTPEEVTSSNDRGGYLAEINGICSYGQSLSVGAQATPAISTTQDYDSLMFTSGVRTSGSVNRGAFVALVENTNGNFGETPVSGAADSIKELVSSEDSLGVNDVDYRIFGSAAGEDAKSITGLKKGSVYYDRFLADVQGAYDLSLAQSSSYQFAAMLWLQGEANYSGGHTKDFYKSEFNSFDSLAEDVKAITGQAVDPVVLTYQTGSHLRYAKTSGIPSAYDAEIALAQLELSNEKPYVFMACPMYQFDYAGTVNEVHLTATDSRVVGAYFGLTYKRVVIDGQDWKPLQPESLSRQGDVLTIKMHVPVPPLVIDTTWVTQNTDYGFRVFDEDGNQVTISSVEVLNKESIKIVTTGAPVGKKLNVDYALSTDSPTGETGRNVGARGNIRDSQGDTIVFDPTGTNRPLHNWLTMFKIEEK